MIKCCKENFQGLLLGILCVMLWSILGYALTRPNSEIINDDLITINNSIQTDTVLLNIQKPKIQKKESLIHQTIHLTCYQPVKVQCNNDPLHTADNSKIDLLKLKKGQIKWVAISFDLEKYFPMGSKVHIYDKRSGKDFGIYEVHDRMNRRWTKRMDILIHPNSNECYSLSDITVEKVL